MVVVVLAVLCGVILGLLRGGSLQRLGELRLNHLLLLAVAVLAQGLAVSGILDQRLALVTSTLFAAAFVLTNRGVPGLGLLTAGLGVNALAVIANGGAMPVSLTALGRINSANGSLLTDPTHIPADSHTKLALITDRIAVPIPFNLGEVLSVGDVLVAAGAGLVIFAATRRSVPKWPDGEKGPQAART